MGIYYNKIVKALRQAEMGLRAILRLSKEEILKNGRSNTVSKCITSHRIQQGHSTRDGILESKKMIVYRKYGAEVKIKKHLQTYKGWWSTPEIEEIFLIVFSIRNRAESKMGS